MPSQAGGNKLNNFRAFKAFLPIRQFSLFYADPGRARAAKKPLLLILKSGRHFFKCLSCNDQNLLY